MFDYQRLNSYQKAKAFNRKISRLLSEKRLSPIVADQLRRASLSIMLNIAEGAGRYTHPDKRNFYIIARGSVFEVAVIVELLRDEEMIGPIEFDEFDSELEQLSKMLFAMIKVYTKKVKRIS